MNEEKLRIIRSSADECKKLPKDKQMYILGYMSGVLSNQQDSKKIVENPKSIERRKFYE